MEGEGPQRQTVSAPASPVPPEQEKTKEVAADALSRSQSLLRQSIKEIHANPNLSHLEKARLVQDLMSVKPRKISELVPALGSPAEEDLRASFFKGDHTSGIFGCSHYRSNCKLQAECCGTWHTCRFCHDEWSEAHSDGHSINRHAVGKMLCQFCHRISPVSQECPCGKQMAKYYCHVCRLFDDDPEKAIFHCADCGICRTGKREDFVHCNRCHGCIDSKYYPDHRCLEGSLDANCPICGDHLFSTVMPVIFMRCGHAIHTLCYSQHCRESYTCPLCSKSVADMSQLFQAIDQTMAISTMPAGYENIMAECLCNDCEKRCVTKYHFYYHKCAFCSGYNTKLIKSFAAEQQVQALSSPQGGFSTQSGLEPLPIPRQNSITPPSLEIVPETDSGASESESEVEANDSWWPI